MRKLVFSGRAACSSCLLALLPLAAAAQNSRQDSLLRAGDLVGGRPHASRPRAVRLGTVSTTTTTATTTTVVRPAPAAGADPVLARLLHQHVVIARTPAAQLPALYDGLVEATRRQGGQWSARDWADVSAAVARLNARYEVVRLELPMDERLNVRSDQGEFQTLKAAHRF